MNNKLKILIGVTGMALFLASCHSQTDVSKQAETIVGRHTVRFTRPPQRIPTKFSVDAPLLGNLFNPWKGLKIKVKGREGEQLYEGERIRINTEKGVTCRLKPVNPVTAMDAVLLWNTDDYLNHPPKAVFGEKQAGSPVREVYYEGELFQGKPTRVFAYLGMPEGPAPFEGKYPAILLIHGGGGKAFADWAERWAKRGYVALAMDLGGQGPDAPLPDGGPGQGDTVKFRDFTVADGDYRNMWTYQSIAAILRGHALLAAQPEVDPDKIAATGISWGGYLTCILAGVDSKLQAAVPVYGCGFLHENSYWKAGTFDLMTPEQRNRWVSLFDPSRYLDRASIPMLFVNGTNDFAYPLDSYRKSYRLPKGETTLSITPRRPHGHIFTFEEVDAFIDAIIFKNIKSVKPLPKVSEMKTDEAGKTVSVTFESEVPVVKAELAWTADTGEWQKREWQTAPATLNDSTVSAPLPIPSPTCYYLLLTDERGLPVSSPIIIKEYE